MDNKRTFVIVLVVVVVLAAIIAVAYWWTSRRSKPNSQSSGLLNEVTYTCDGGKTINASFYEKDVKLLLNDDRNLDLPVAMSASGARYANSDESIVFWNTGDTAFITEGDKTTFENCIE